MDSEGFDLAALEAADERSVELFRELLALGRRFLAGELAPGEPIAGMELAQAALQGDEVRRRMETNDLVLTGAVAASGAWMMSGARSCGAWLASNTEASRSVAAGRVRTGTCLLGLPETLRACLSGVLGGAKATLLARVGGDDRLAELFATHESDIVRDVAPLTVDATRHYLAAWEIRAKAALGIDAGDPGHGPVDHLHLSRIGDRWRIDGELSCESGAILDGALNDIIDTWHRDGALVEDTCTPSQHRAAALIELARHPATAGHHRNDPRPLVIALIDADTLDQRRRAQTRRHGNTPGHQPPQPGVDTPPGTGPPFQPVHEILGAGPVPAETIDRLLCEGDICRVITNGQSMPLDLGRRHRLATTHQRRAVIAAAHGTCQWPGCTAPHQHCAVHHLQDWNHNGPTDINNLALVCNHHHRLIHENHFNLTRNQHGTLTATNPDGNPVTVAYRPRP